MNGWNPKANEIFLDASDRAPGNTREDFISEACGSDDELRRQVLSLLAASEKADDFLEIAIVVEDDDPLTTHSVLPSGDSETKRQRSPGLSQGVSVTSIAESELEAIGQLEEYEILEPLGRGGMGIVLKARDLHLKRVVAIKILAPELATSETARRRFLREAQAAAAVRHEHVVTIHRVCEANKLPFLVMEYVEGPSLEQRINRDGALDVPEVTRIGAEVAAGLAAAHAQGLVHRDIKPANILLESASGRVKITDFGLARATDDARLTQSGVVTGTPQYMAPEQACGEALDHRADLFSLGSVLYAMCTGQAPFQATTTMGTLRRVCEQAPRPIRELNPCIPEWLAALVERLHVKQPAGRFSSASELAKLLRKRLDEVSAPGEGAGSEDETNKVGGRHRVHRGVLAVIAMLILAFGITESSGVTRFLSTILSIETGDGMLVVEVEDPAISVQIDGTDVLITGAGLKELRLRPGVYKVLATKDGQPVQESTIAIIRDEKRLLTIRSVATPRPGGNAVEPEGPRILPKAEVPFEVKAAHRLEGHADPVHVVAFTPDSKRILSGGGERNESTPVPGTDFSIKLWDVATGNHLLDLVGHDGPIFSLALSRNGRRALSGGGKMVYLWDLETGERLQEFVGHPSYVRWVAFSRDESKVLSAGFDGKVRIWDIESATEIQALDHQGHWVWAAAISPNDSNLIAAAQCAWDRDCAIHLWSGQPLQKKRELLGHTRVVRGLAFTADGQRLISGGWDSVIRIWDVKNGSQLDAFQVSPINDLKLLANDRYLLVATLVGELHLIDLEKSQMIWSGRDGAGIKEGVAVSPDERWMASCGQKENVVRLWRLPTLK